MTDYNDGKWHGWNGGECPVHPKTKINGLEPGGTHWTANAEDCEWKSFNGAFRVVKEYKEPREFWVEVITYGATATRLQNLENAWINLKTQSELAELTGGKDE